MLKKSLDNSRYIFWSISKYFSGERKLQNCCTEPFQGNKKIAED